MASVQGIGLSDKNRIRIADYKRTIEFEGSKPGGAGNTLPVISDTSVSLNGGLDEELSLLDMTSLRQQNADFNGGAIPYPAPVPAPIRPTFGASRRSSARHDSRVLPRRTTRPRCSRTRRGGWGWAWAA